VSVLTLSRLKGESLRNAWCDIPGCRKSGAVKAEILGWPAGRVCRWHSREWRRAWDDAAGVPDEAAA
jgi:hypothetical protein